MEKYRYTKPWFIGSGLNLLATKYVDTTKKNTILEIGCYEGLSSVFLADNLLDHPDSSLTCVDPFLTIDTNDHKDLLTNGEELNFDHNIKICKNTNKIIINKITSDKFFETNDKIFNFIYIDGCHENDYITRDMENSFKALESGGIMWMDDYGGGSKVPIRYTMDKFLEKYAGQYELIYKGWQLAIRKN